MPRAKISRGGRGRGGKKTGAGGGGKKPPPGGGGKKPEDRPPSRTKGICRTCKGTGLLPCIDCNGSGRRNCSGSDCLWRGHRGESENNRSDYHDCQCVWGGATIHKFCPDCWGAKHKEKKDKEKKD